MSRVWQWRELAWRSPVAPTVAVAALERLATAVELGPVVLEMRARAGGVRWLVGCQSGRVTELKRLLGHHLPVRVFPPETQRAAVSQAVRLQVRRDQVSAVGERIVAATRALYATVSDLSGDQQVVMQLVIGRRLPSSFFTGPPEPGWRELLLGSPAPKTSERTARTTGEQHGAVACLRLGYTGRADQAHQLFTQILGALRTVETTEARFRLGCVS